MEIKVESYLMQNTGPNSQLSAPWREISCTWYNLEAQKGWQKMTVICCFIIQFITKEFDYGLYITPISKIQLKWTLNLLIAIYQTRIFNE